MSEIKKHTFTGPITIHYEKWDGHHTEESQVDPCPSYKEDNLFTCSRCGETLNSHGHVRQSKIGHRLVCVGDYVVYTHFEFGPGYCITEVLSHDEFVKRYGEPGKPEGDAVIQAYENMDGQTEDS